MCWRSNTWSRETKVTFNKSCLLRSWFRSCLVQLNKSRRCCLLDGSAVRTARRRRARPLGGCQLAFEIRVAFGRNIGQHGCPTGFESGLVGVRGAQASSIAGTMRYSGYLLTGTARNSQCHDVVASWLHRTRFGATLRRFAQELGKCLFVTRLVPRLCIAQRSTASVQST